MREPVSADTASAQRTPVGQRTAPKSGSSAKICRRCAPTRSAARSTRCARRRAIDPGADRFVCASAGNHAQGVAFVCRHFGVHGTIFMPVTTPRQKIDKTRVVRRRRRRDRTDRRLFRRHAAVGQGALRADRRAFPVAVRRRGRDRGPGKPSRWRCSTRWPSRPKSSCCPWAVAGCPAGMRRYLCADGPGCPDDPGRAGGRGEPHGRARGRRAGDLAARRHVRGRRRRGPDRRADLCRS